MWSLQLPPGPGRHDTDRCFSSAANWVCTNSLKLVTSLNNKKLLEMRNVLQWCKSAKLKESCRQTLQNLQQRCYLTSCLQTDIPPLHLNIALCPHFSLFTCTLKKSLGAKTSPKWGCTAKAPPTKADEIFPEFVEISSRQNLHSFPALGKLIILTAEWKLVQNAQTFDNLSKGDDFTQVQKKEKYFILYLWNWNESHLL